MMFLCFFAECTFRQFMQKAIQLPSPTVSPRQTPPPSGSPGVPVSGLNSPPKQHTQSQPQNISTTPGIGSSSYATVSMSPPKRRGPPSPLSLSGSGQSPPPSFSSVAAGHSPKPSSPLLKLEQVPKGQGAVRTVVAGGPNQAASSIAIASPSSSKAYNDSAARAITFVSGGDVNVRQSVPRPGKLADITGPADSYEQVGFPFIVAQKEVQSGVNVTTVSHLYQPELHRQTVTTVSVGPQACVGSSNVKGGAFGINTLAGSSSPVVASVSSRRNYRVASTSADVPTTPPGVFGQINRGNVVVTSPSSQSASRVLDATVKSESVALKGMWLPGINNCTQGFLLPSI